MALLFDLYSDRYSRSGLPTWGNHSGCFWVKAGAASGGQLLFVLSDRFVIYHNTTTLGLYDLVSGVPYASITMAQGEWHNVAWEQGSGTARLYLDGVKASTDMTLNASANNSTMFVGGSDSGALLVNAEYEGLIIWDGVQLGADYWLSQSKLRAPLALANLWGWWPWIDAVSPGTDLSGTGRTLTGGATTPTLTQGPPAPWRGSRNRVVNVAAAAASSHEAVATLTARRATLTATAQVSVTATATLTARRPTLAATATATVTAVATLTARRPLLTATASAALTATATLTARRPTLTATASVQVTAVATLTARRPTLIATATVGAGPVTAVATLTARRATLTATATVAVAATATLTARRATLAATAAVTVAAVATLTARRPTLIARATTYAGGPVVVMPGPRAVAFGPTVTALALDATRTALALEPTRTALRMEA